jgi:hypothetical protein
MKSITPEKIKVKRVDDVYNAYVATGGKVDKATFKSILSTFNDSFMTSVVNEGVCYTLPYNIGVLGVTIAKRPPGKVNRNLGEPVQLNLNLHSERISGAIIFFKDKKVSKLPDSVRNLYRFHAVRKYNRLLAFNIKEKNSIMSYQFTP